MKIRREEIDGELSLITPCSECLFFDGDCKFGRLNKYKQLGKVINSPPEITTFCNYARPPEWQKDKTLNECKKIVQESNKIKYDLIARITSAKEVQFISEFLNRKNPPARVIFSFTNIDVAEIVDQANLLGCSFELLKILDSSSRFEAEMGRVKQTWSETVDMKNYSVELMDSFEKLINENLEQIVAVTGEQYIIMTILVAAMDLAGLKCSLDNIVEMAKIQGTTKNIRRFDGNSIRNYS